jgi:hypothetical protein
MGINQIRRRWDLLRLRTELKKEIKMKTPTYAPIGRMTPRFLAEFDSTSAMMTALGKYLRGGDTPGMDTASLPEWLGREINKFVRQTRETMHTLSGFMEAIPPESLDKIHSGQMSKWVINNYPKKPVPAVAIGASSGALTHLQVALGIPWLPQTFLIPVRRPSDMHVDQPKLTMKWAADPARLLLKNNPDLQLHHVFDPNQDRHMLENMAYFRVKKLRLGTIYERFITDVLPPGGTIFVSECQRKWPATKVDNRHFFQFGSVGGASEKEFLEGSARVEKFLNQYESPVRKWDAPKPDGEIPEAEWGFETALYEDIERIAREGGYKIKRIVFEEPDHPSPFVAELYRWWYRQRRILSNRLVAGSFTLIEPYWTLRTGSVPFWMKYNMEPAAKSLEEYLNDHDNYDELYLMLYPAGKEGIGMAAAEHWESILAKAKKRGKFLGADAERMPGDFDSFIRNNTDFKNSIKSRYPIPGPLGIRKFSEFAEKSEGRYKIRFVDYRSQDINSEPAADRIKESRPTRPATSRKKQTKTAGVTGRRAQQGKTTKKQTETAAASGKQSEQDKKPAGPSVKDAQTG